MFYIVKQYFKTQKLETFKHIKNIQRTFEQDNLAVDIWSIALVIKIIYV